MLLLLFSISVFTNHPTIRRYASIRVQSETTEILVKWKARRIYQETNMGTDSRHILGLSLCVPNFCGTGHRIICFFTKFAIWHKLEREYFTVLQQVRPVSHIRDPTIMFANSPQCACRGSSGQKPRYGLMTLAYQRFTSVLFLIYGRLWVASIIVWVCFGVPWRECRSSN
jgi:hypothetical protein